MSREKTTKSAATNNILLSDWLSEKIQRTNFALTDFMHMTLVGHRKMEKLFAISLDDMQTFKQQIGPKANPMNLPFLALAPVLENPRDWQTFVDGAIVSPKVEKLTSELPIVDQATSRDVFHYNRTYVQLLKDVLHMSVVAVPLLGISTELAEYIKSLPIARLEMAIGAVRFPLFRWRFDDIHFWKEYGAGWLTDESVAHYLMRTSPLSAAALPYKHAWTDLRLERSEKEILARMMMAQGCRAKTASNLFNLNPTKARTTYKEIHGVSSPCGCNPSSLTWYVQRSAHRLQASVYVWLYRSALRNDANIPQALIAANDIMAKMFGKNLLITADRANHRKFSR